MTYCYSKIAIAVKGHYRRLVARPAPAADRAASIVSFLTAHPSRGFTISELVRHLGMNIASAHATLAVLCDCGFLIRDPAHRTYVLGPALAATGFAALDQHPAVEAAIEQAEVLADELDAEIGVSAIAGRDVILLARRGPEALTPSIGYPGDRAPLLAPFGAVFMAWADDDAIAAWLERAELTDQFADHYRAVLADIRARGFSVPMGAIGAPEVMAVMARLRNEPADDTAEQDLADVLHHTTEMLFEDDELIGTEEIVFKTVAAPIFDPIGRVLLSLSVTGTGRPMPAADVVELGRRVARSASIVTRQARGRHPDLSGSPRAIAR
jgi:DNA-binding IclR family transcriptional regulator